MKKLKNNMKDGLIGFLIVLVILLSREVLTGSKYDVMERYLMNHYYSKDNLTQAMKDKLGNEYEESAYLSMSIADNFDSYVYNLVLDDINRYEDEKLAKYNTYYKQEKATEVLKNIEQKQSLIVEEKADICYIKIPAFVKNFTYKEFIQNQEIYNSNTKFIIDLRDNTGGDINELVKIMSVFYEKDKVLYTYIKSDEIIEKKAKGGEKIIFDKIAFLCNEKTASASEAMIFNMKTDFEDRIITIGDKTYGKNFCYSYKKFKDDELFMFVTGLLGNSKGITFDIDGIEPDFTVEDNDCLHKAIELLNCNILYE